MVQILLPTLDGIPRRAGVPPLNPSKLQPVYPTRGEDAALDHFLFGGNADSLFGLKGAASFTPVSASPIYQDNYLTTVDGVLNGLAGSIAESPAFTVCMVVRYEIQDGKAVLYVGTTRAGNGDAKGWGVAAWAHFRHYPAAPAPERVSHGDAGQQHSRCTGEVDLPLHAGGQCRENLALLGGRSHRRLWLDGQRVRTIGARARHRQCVLRAADRHAV